MGILAHSPSLSTSICGGRALQHRDRGARLGAILTRHFFRFIPLGTFRRRGELGLHQYAFAMALVFRAPHAIGGGLNNQVLHLTQLLACNGTLELPRFLAGDDFFIKRRRRGDPYSNRSLAFGEVCDEDSFRESVRPCSTTSAGGANASTAKLVQINANWFRDAARVAMVPPVYTALWTGTLVRGPFTEVLRAVEVAAGVARRGRRCICADSN